MGHPAGDAKSVRLWKLHKDNTFVSTGWVPQTNSTVIGVRAVTPPPMPLLDDPDSDGLPPGDPLVSGISHSGSIVYAAMERTPEIAVMNDKFGTRYVKITWDHYLGIDIDPYYLWLFLPGFIACATHASVIQCINGGREKPRWIEYTIPATAAPKGLKSFCPCEDGTIVASDNNLDMWIANYSVDVNRPSLNITNWKKLSGKGIQIRKVPVPCWSLLQTLEHDLQLQKA